MNKFIKEVNKLINKGKLLQADGQPLIDKAEAVQDLIGCT